MKPMPLHHRALLLAAIAIPACLWPWAARSAEVVFGQVASLSNPTSASNARGLVAGISACFESINAKGGVNGHRLRLETRDDGLQPPKMVELTDALVKDSSIVGLLGYLNTGGINALAKADAFGKGGIALIAPLQGDRNIVDADNVFPLRSGFADEVNALLKESQSWGKDQIAVVNMNIAFGPPLAELAHKRAKEMGLKVVSHSVLDYDPEKLGPSVAAAVRAISASQPKAILLLAAGRPATEFAKAVREAPAGATQVYGLSVLLHEEVVKAIGADKARGIVLSQVIPYPFTASAPVIGEYQQAMKAYAPSEPLSFSSLEGYLGAKIAAEAVRRSGSVVTRERLLASLRGMGEYNLGGVYVHYAPERKKGWGGVELTIINAAGNLRK
ncbi:MAG TPA: ABC transporter substrate-binding protein [Ramlibacter sp.]|nr:ABC transporter substrate-binding protein [Ramlibacter sp.]